MIAPTDKLASVIERLERTARMATDDESDMLAVADHIDSAVATLRSLAASPVPGPEKAGAVLPGSDSRERERAVAIIKSLRPDDGEMEKWTGEDDFSDGFRHACAKALAVIANGAESWSGEPGRAEPGWDDGDAEKVRIERAEAEAGGGR